MVIELQLEAATDKLEQADTVIRTLDDVRRCISSLIIACLHLVEIVQHQQEKIEHLEDILQGQLERRR